MKKLLLPFLILFSQISFSQSTLRTADNCDCRCYINSSFTWDGDCKDGYCDGWGTIKLKTRVYTGNVIKGVFSGFGTVYQVYYGSLTKEYEGEWRNNELTGKAKYYYPNGRILYDGEVTEGKFNGYGKLFDKNEGIIYEGNFYNIDPYSGKNYCLYGNPQDGSCLIIWINSHSFDITTYKGEMRNGY